MELSQVREILNAVIVKVNQTPESFQSYEDLSERPCINGVVLTAETTAAQLNLTLSQLGNETEIESMVTRVVEETAANVTKNALANKLDSDFTQLPEMKYNFKEDMLLTISDGGSIFKANISDLLLYLKYLILQDNIFEKTVGKPASKSCPYVERKEYHRYSEEEKLAIIEDYLESGLSKSEIWRKYTGRETGSSTILYWMYQYGYVSKSDECPICTKENKPDTETPEPEIIG